MEYSPVEIQSHNSKNPENQETFTLICHGHRVRIIVTAKPAVIRKWVYAIRFHHRHQLRRGRLVVGLGVQWTPGGNAATLQLCVGHRCIIVQLQYAALVPSALRRLLADASITFVGAWNYMDARLLQESPHRVRISHLLDVRDAASEWRGLSRRLSTEMLAGELLGWDGVEKNEWVGRSDWDQEWLSEEQVEYACVDAFLSFMMGKVLGVWKWD